MPEKNNYRSDNSSRFLTKQEIEKLIKKLQLNKSDDNSTSETKVKDENKNFLIEEEKNGTNKG